MVSSCIIYGNYVWQRSMHVRAGLVLSPEHHVGFYAASGKRTSMHSSSVWVKVTEFEFTARLVAHLACALRDQWQKSHMLATSASFFKIKLNIFLDTLI